MAKIFVRAEHTLLVNEAGLITTGCGTFTLSIDGIVFTVDVDYGNGRITAVASDVPISDDGLNELEKRRSIKEATNKIASELNGITTRLTAAPRNVISILKYHLGHEFISEHLFSSGSTEWSKDQVEWKHFPRQLSVTAETRWVVPLANEVIHQVQEEIDSGISPLIGVRHLHRARRESMPHHKWIDATIAAELAIKEILIRARPELERLLLEVPSPPLSKLYGSLLEHYVGERSPYLSRLQRGVELRNELVHRPNATRIDGQEAIDYVDTVEAAILHALRLLYPKDALLKWKYERLAGAALEMSDGQ